MEVKSIVNSFMSSMTYVLSEHNSNYVWLVDCGDADKVIGLIGGKNVKGVLLSHAHYDHIYGLPTILNMFPDCRIYTNSYGVKALASAKLNLSKYHEDSIEISGPMVCETKDGKEIELFPDIKALVYETPGHNPSCLCFKVQDYLFTGDTYIPDLNVVTNLPGGDKQQAEASFERIRALIQNNIVCAGHA